MEEFVSDFFGRSVFSENGYSFDFSPRAKVKDNETNYTITVALPGFKKEDVDIKVEDDELIISSDVEKDEYKKSFENKYSMPEDADKENIVATMEDGILTVVIGKYKEIPKTNIKKIDIK